MSHSHLYKNAKQGKKENPPHPNARASEKMEEFSLQRSSSSFCSPPASKKAFSYSQANHAQNRLIIQENLSFLQSQKEEAQGQKKKRFLTSPTQKKNNHVRSLSESFINLIMVDGKKSKAEKIFSQTLKKLARHLQSDMKRENRSKREIALFDRKENPPCVHFALQNVSKRVDGSLPSKEEHLLGNTKQESLLVLRRRVEKGNVHNLIQKAIDNVKPTLQVRKVRVARSIYQVPFIMKKRRQERSAVRWIIENAKRKSRYSGSTFSECLAQVVLEAFMGQGQVKEKRDQLHRTAEANRTYLRYRWW